LGKIGDAMLTDNEKIQRNYMIRDMCTSRDIVSVLNDFDTMSDEDIQSLIATWQGNKDIDNQIAELQSSKTDIQDSYTNLVANRVIPTPPVQVPPSEN
jgi:hypothetical protein